MIRKVFDVVLLDLLVLLCSLRLIAAAVRTITIDDTYGDEATGAFPVYAPPAEWLQGHPCDADDDACLVNPDPSMVRNGTWHDSVGSSVDAPPRTIDLAFQGNSISVYCIVSEVDRVEIGVSNMTFELDGQEVGKFFRDVSGQTDAAGDYEIHYNFQVLNHTVSQGNHTLRINSVGYSRMLFDYALYTTNSDLSNTTVSPLDSSPSPTVSGQASSDASRDTHPNVGVIAGATAAGTIALLAIGILLFVFLRRRRRLMRRYEVDHSDSRLKPKRRLRGHGGGEDANYSSSVASLPYEESLSTASSHPHPYPPHSRYRQGSGGSSQEHSPSDSDVPLMGISPPHTDPFSRGQQPRFVQVGGETRLEGPDNSMARLARKEIAEREAELKRRVREVENALATRRSTDRRPEADSSPNSSTARFGPSQTGTASIPSSSSTLPPHEGHSEAVLRDQLNELRAEMERMKTIQQRMTLELRDAIEPPPGYHPA